MSRELIEKMARAMLYEREQWGGIRTNKGKKKPFELVRHSDPEVVTPVVMAAWVSYEDAELEAPLVIEAAVARAILPLLSDPANITPEMVTAACESRAKDDEGEFPALADLIDFSGENKTHTVVRTAIAAAFSERAP